MLLGRARPPRRPLFPYTTLFRSPEGGGRGAPDAVQAGRVQDQAPEPAGGCRRRVDPAPEVAQVRRPSRSEEHTSELQSRENLVCRLLLEKKNQEILATHDHWSAS